MEAFTFLEPSSDRRRIDGPADRRYRVDGYASRKVDSPQQVGDACHKDDRRHIQGAFGVVHDLESDDFVAVPDLRVTDAVRAG